MKEGTIRGIQVAANVAIIIAAALLSAVLIKSYIIAKPDGPAQASNRIIEPNRATRAPVDVQIQPGIKIGLSGVDWAKNGRTLLLAVSDKCHFCSESAPFYQRLAKQHGKIRLVAVLPQPVDEGKKYLDGLNVNVDEIRQAPLTSIGIKGTPTLILVDENGAAVQAWRGKLTSDKEAEVLAKLQ
jgi:hypothetical protein